jgi:hypothetical protein
LEKEGRILSDFTGDQTSYSINFIPKMDLKVLLEGYQKIIHDTYSSKMFYKRVLTFLKSYKPPVFYKNTISLEKLIPLIKSVFIIGILGKNRRYYWYLLLWSLFRKPEVFSLAVTYSIHGYHFRKVFRGIS